MDNITQLPMCIDTPRVATLDELKETQQLAETQIMVLRDTMQVDINNLKDKTNKYIADLHHALQSAIMASKNSEAKLTAITDTHRNDINAIRDSLILYTDYLSSFNTRLHTAFKYIYVLSGVLIAETGYLIYKFL